MSAAARLRRLGAKLGNGHFAVADQLAMVGGNFLMNLILARAGDLEAFGSFSVLYALLVLVNAGQSALIGEPLALSRELDAQQRPRALDGQRASLQIVLPFSALLAVHAFATMPGLGLFHALLFVLACTACSAYWSSKGRLHALGKHRSAFNASLSGGVVVVATALLAITRTDAVTAGLVAIVVSSLCGLAVALHADGERRAHASLSLRGVAELGKAGLPIALLVWIANNIVFLMLGQAQRLDDAAGLRAILTLLLPVNQVMIGCSAFVLPQLAAMSRAGEQARIAAFSGRALAVSVGAALVFGVATCLAAGPVSRLVLGPQFDPYIQALRLVAIALPASWACVIVVRAHFQGGRRPRFVLFGYVSALVLGVPVAAWALHQDGAWAAAAATLAIHGSLAVVLFGLFVFDVRARRHADAHARTSEIARPEETT